MTTATIISVPMTLLGERATRPPQGSPFEAEQDAAELHLTETVAGYLDWWRRYTNRWLRAEYAEGYREWEASKAYKVRKPKLRQRYMTKATGDFLSEPEYWTVAKQQFDADLWVEAQSLIRDGALQAQQLGLPIAFDLVNDTVVSYSRTFMNDWWAGLATSTRNQMQTTISNWIQSGAPLSNLTKQLTPLFGPGRAKMIAATETTRMYADGNTLGYTAAGVTTVEWRTSRDERVCQICLPLHGDKFPTGSNRPPAHVSCRCSIVPVTADGKALDKKVGQPEGAVRPWDFRKTPAQRRSAMVRQMKGYEKGIRDKLTPSEMAQIAKAYSTTAGNVPRSVLAEEARSMMKAHVERNLISRSGVSNANDYIFAWTQSSANHTHSMAMQLAASEEFGVPINAYLKGRLPHYTGYVEWETWLAEARKVVRATYDLSQEYFASQGITSLRLFRGMGWSTGEAPAEIEALFANAPVGTGITRSPQVEAVMNFDFNVLSSWSIDIDTAKYFSHRGRLQVMAGIDVDVGRVFANPFTGPGCLNEYEFIVLGGPTDTFIVDTVTAMQLLVDDAVAVSLAVP